jgi:raffinose/stachyose/melibiose transport system substrate-binding protein
LEAAKKSESGASAKKTDSATSPVEIVIWDHDTNMVDNEAYYSMLKREMLKEGISLSYEGQQMESYHQVLLTALMAKTGFDIAFDWCGPTYVGKAKRGVWLDLTGKIPQDHLNQLLGVNSAIVNGKLYGLPFTIDMQMMFYNKTLFRKAGVTPEEFGAGFEGLTSASNKLKAIGVAPMEFTNKEGYMNEWYYCMGIGSIFKTPEDFTQQFISGHDFTEKRYVDMLKNYKKAVDLKFFIDGQTLDFASHYTQTFIRGESATMFCGIGFYDTLIEGGMNPSDLGVMPWPSLANGGYPHNYFASLIYGGSSFTKHPDEVIKTLIRITQPDLQTAFFNLKGMDPANSAADLSGSTNPLSKEAQALAAKDLMEYPYNYLESETLDLIYKDLQLVVTGEMSPEDWSARMQRTSAAARAAQN